MVVGPSHRDRATLEFADSICLTETKVRGSLQQIYPMYASLTQGVLLIVSTAYFRKQWSRDITIMCIYSQELIEPAKPAREHANPYTANIACGQALPLPSPAR